MWYILEIEGNPKGSTRLDSAVILAIGLNLQHAQNQAVMGYIDAMEGSGFDGLEKEAVDFAYVVQQAHAADRQVIALQMQANGTLRPHNS